MLRFYGSKVDNESSPSFCHIKSAFYLRIHYRTWNLFILFPLCDFVLEWGSNCDLKLCQYTQIGFISPFYFRQKNENYRLSPKLQNSQKILLLELFCKKKDTSIMHDFEKICVFGLRAYYEALYHWQEVYIFHNYLYLNK